MEYLSEDMLSKVLPSTLGFHTFYIELLLFQIESNCYSSFTFPQEDSNEGSEEITIEEKIRFPANENTIPLPFLCFLIDCEKTEAELISVIVEFQSDDNEDMVMDKCKKEITLSLIDKLDIDPQSNTSFFDDIFRGLVVSQRETNRLLFVLDFDKLIDVLPEGRQSIRAIAKTCRWSIVDEILFRKQIGTQPIASSVSAWLLQESMLWHLYRSETQEEIPIPLALYLLDHYEVASEMKLSEKRHPVIIADRRNDYQYGNHCGAVYLFLTHEMKGSTVEGDRYAVFPIHCEYILDENIESHRKIIEQSSKDAADKPEEDDESLDSLEAAQNQRPNTFSSSFYFVETKLFSQNEIMYGIREETHFVMI